MEDANNPMEKSSNAKSFTSFAIDIIRFVVLLLPHYRSCDGTSGCSLF